MIFLIKKMLRWINQFFLWSVSSAHVLYGVFHHYTHDVNTWSHIFVGKVTIIGSDNGLSHSPCQAIIWANTILLVNGTLGTNFSEILSEIHTFASTKMHLKVPSTKWRQLALGLNVLIYLMLLWLYYHSLMMWLINHILQSCCTFTGHFLSPQHKIVRVLEGNFLGCESKRSSPDRSKPQPNRRHSYWNVLGYTWIRLMNRRKAYRLGPRQVGKLSSALNRPSTREAMSTQAAAGSLSIKR